KRSNANVPQTQGIVKRNAFFDILRISLLMSPSVCADRESVSRSEPCLARSSYLRKAVELFSENTWGEVRRERNGRSTKRGFAVAGQHVICRPCSFMYAGRDGFGSSDEPTSIGEVL